MFARDEFEALSPDEIIDRLKSCFDPWWAFGQLSERQISILRSVIHPQIVISPLVEATRAEQPLAVLTYVKSGMRTLARPGFSSFSTTTLRGQVRIERRLEELGGGQVARLT